jgi:hypothetical protein
MELGENEAVKRAVASGQGITVISAKAAKEEIEAGTLRAVRLSGSRLRRRFFLIHHRDRPLSRLIRASWRRSSATKPGKSAEAPPVNPSAPLSERPRSERPERKDATMTPNTPPGFGLIIIGSEILDGRVRDSHFENTRRLLQEHRHPLVYA